MGNAAIIDRVHLLIRKYLRLRETHGRVKGTELFVEEYGQKAMDEMFDYLVSCSTPENHAAAEAKGHEGCYVIPLVRR